MTAELAGTYGDCVECDAPAETSGGHWADGVDFDGVPARFFLLKVLCAAGHRYCLVDEERTVRFEEAT